MAGEGVVAGSSAVRQQNGPGSRPPTPFFSPARFARLSDGGVLRPR
jgi:hypothetical protein